MSGTQKKLGARHKARKRAVDLLFEAEARDVHPADLAADRVELAIADDQVAPVPPYAQTIINGVADNLDETDRVIADHLHEWTLDRLPAVDRAILRIAVWELFHATDVPPVVAVDEAVELAKQLSTDDSPAIRQRRTRPDRGGRGPSARRSRGHPGPATRRGALAGLRRVLTALRFHLR